MVVKWHGGDQARLTSAIFALQRASNAPVLRAGSKNRERDVHMTRILALVQAKEYIDMLIGEQLTRNL